MEEVTTIHHFWFGDDPDDVRVAQEKAALWWLKSAEVDSEIRRRFEGTLERAAGGELDAWRDTGQGRLALILLADQVPRHIYRNTSAAFAYDGLAREWAKEGIAAGVDTLLRPIERVFFYLPLEHSELLADQEMALAHFTALRDNADARALPVFDGFLDYAQRHRDVIARFGRFPHRNRICGRASTPEEEAFLREPGSSF
jgi:uncharacterized protein (DUF924 family)